mmetsp:Transcript_93129/g.240663  ORF Transcript_93129/g.240663 Transcript_93129/m.240663 type:complete len:271 (+) Transcript_93129:1017-1829(+)
MNCSGLGTMPPLRCIRRPSSRWSFSDPGSSSTCEMRSSKPMGLGEGCTQTPNQPSFVRTSHSCGVGDCVPMCKNVQTPPFFGIVRMLRQVGSLLVNREVRISWSHMWMRSDGSSVKRVQLSSLREYAASRMLFSILCIASDTGSSPSTRSRKAAGVLNAQSYIPSPVLGASILLRVRSCSGVSSSFSGCCAFSSKSSIGNHGDFGESFAPPAWAPPVHVHAGPPLEAIARAGRPAPGRGEVLGPDQEEKTFPRPIRGPAAAWARPPPAHA